jgi:hypothetical protein
MFKSETTRVCVTTSKLSAPQGSFCHLDFGHLPAIALAQARRAGLVLFRISYFVLRICAFYGETTYAPLWGVSSKPSPLGEDYLVSHPKTAILGRSGKALISAFGLDILAPKDNKIVLTILGLDKTMANGVSDYEGS